MIIYQIYPRSFGDSNQDGLGDLPGITAHLPYLANLGVEALWISPFFKSPMKDFGYDVSDYCAIDPMFGTMTDFDALMAGSKRHGLQMMIDMVLSHSSDEHPWFTESRSSRDNPKADWYVWGDAAPDGGPPNNWVSLFGGVAWEWEPKRQQFYLHNFLKEQPDFNFHEPQVRAALLDACEFWFKKGVRGIRLDVCNFYFHSAGLESNPSKAVNATDTEGVHAGNPYNFQQHVYDKDRPENLKFLADLRAVADKYPGATLMGEVVSDDSLGVMSQYIDGGGPLHTAYNFSLFRHGFDGTAFAKVLSEFETRLSGGAPTWALSNHDVPRFTSRFCSDAGWPQSTKCFLAFLFCLRGNVILYQGDELGLDEAEIPFEQMQDPFGIAFYPEFKGRDGCRTPFPWTAERASEKMWLPIPDSHLRKSAAVQAGDTTSVLEFARTLIQWRKTNAWLTVAPLEVLSATAETIVLRRKDSHHELVAAVNGSKTVQTVIVPASVQIELAPYEFKIWENGLVRLF
jgi:alpha-glucosidase